MLSAVVLSFNRRDTLLKTLAALNALGPGVLDEIIVADNASGDGSLDAVRERFPAVRTLALDTNTGVGAYNRAAEIARGDLLLILDDDSWPDGPSLRAAVALLRERPEIGGVALHPVHPASNAPEWPFLRGPSDRCPVMGCGNLVRAQAWRRAGGYEESFFLYRNDTDLAMKLLGAGMGVHARPDWVVWHDSPHAARKSERWLGLATRNWLWLWRRHGRGASGLLGALLGVAWALRQAGASARRLACVARGAWEGVARPCPRVPSPVGRDGRAFAGLISLRLRRR